MISKTELPCLHTPQRAMCCLLLFITRVKLLQALVVSSLRCMKPGSGNNRSTFVASLLGAKNTYKDLVKQTLGKY